ncbi:hypothetical protein [Streptomyces sp. NPDC057545]|uniref:hypothetical protein n=1 Tax=Streptomyces sp. NPDC057545 TaxID=3346164 RepID=UPI0036B0FE3B
MAQTKFDKQVETAESLMFGIGRFLAGRPMDGAKRTDATFWRSGTRVLPKVEGRVSRSSYRAGWKRLTFRISTLAAIGAGGYQAGWVHQDATVATAQEIWADPDPAIAALEQIGIAAASTAGPSRSLRTTTPQVTSGRKQSPGLSRSSLLGLLHPTR